MKQTFKEDHWQLVMSNATQVAVIKLCQFFESKQNISYERHLFRQQKVNERIDMFMMRLREQAERCDLITTFVIKLQVVGYFASSR